jgi:hypothetical protein
MEFLEQARNLVPFEDVFEFQYGCFHAGFACGLVVECRHLCLRFRPNSQHAVYTFVFSQG